MSYYFWLGAEAERELTICEWIELIRMTHKPYLDVLFPAKQRDA